MKVRTAVLALSLTLAACAGDPRPEALNKGQDLCASCRMPVSDAHFVTQIVAPGELPRFFDEVGCMAEYLRSGQLKTDGAVAWVADHRTEAWVRADRAVYTRVPTLRTPMNHQVIAHESEASRDADADARGGQPVTAQEIFGPKGPPSGV